LYKSKIERLQQNPNHLDSFRRCTACFQTSPEYIKAVELGLETSGCIVAKYYYMHLH